MENSLLFIIGFFIALMVTGSLVYGRIKFGRFLDEQNPMKELTENRLKIEKSQKLPSFHPPFKNPIQLSLAQALFRKAESQEDWFSFPKQEGSDPQLPFRKSDR